jgi:hypothetical protein
MGHYLLNFSRKGAAKGKTLRAQAAELLQVRMWGIGAKTPNRLSLAPGDRVLIYVGAPEYEFIGHAELGSTTHDWTPAEAAKYPGAFDGGIVFTEAEVWPHPVPMKTVLSKLALKETNPGAHFFSGVVRVSKEDYETVVSVGTGKAPPIKPTGPVAPTVSHGAMAPTGGARAIDAVAAGEGSALRRWRS